MNCGGRDTQQPWRLPPEGWGVGPRKFVCTGALTVHISPLFNNKKRGLTNCQGKKPKTPKHLCENN